MSPAAVSPLAPVSDGVRVALRVTPRASRAGVAGLGTDAAGRSYLKLRVNAPAEGGKANAAVLKLLARAWGVPPSRMQVVVGAKDRFKVVHVAGDSRALAAQLSVWIEKQNND